MTEEELKTIAIEVLCDLAPDIDPDDVGPDTNLREELELDSMDFLNFVIALHERLGVDIPEADYPKLVTLSGCVSYLAKKLASVGA